MSQPPGPYVTSGDRGTLVLKIILGVLIAIVLAALAFTAYLLARPSTSNPPSTDTTGGATTPSPTPAPSPSPPPSDAGSIGAQLIRQGLVCTVELTDPLIHGCGKRGDQVIDFRWQGPVDDPVALDVFVCCQAANGVSATTLVKTLSALTATRLWSNAELSQVAAKVKTATSTPTMIGISWGDVKVVELYGGTSLRLTGKPGGASPVTVKPVSLTDSPQTAQATLERLGLTCVDQADGSSRNVVCTSGSTEIRLFITASRLTGIIGRYRDDTGLAAMIAATGSDGVTLGPIITEGSTVDQTIYRGIDGRLVVCSQTDITSCSVFGVAWD